ncbi:hypothetical protein HYH03_000411 [Edaphochlamys debaryana]|uniref:Uncharacterized protein n=1 Tax=Edaphochlamys debaryana TaxID=47281 RepID=A0A836C764_9CHLO|nr:hypothetical protein HYH03_000411 [Edaphochlamys debaryana]|eukprot:KAG2501913.1 hypothetical protein HYH03_000411 [Edaphochlamys debaryana]
MAKLLDAAAGALEQAAGYLRGEAEELRQPPALRDPLAHERDQRPSFEPSSQTRSGEAPVEPGAGPGEPSGAQAEGGQGGGEALQDTIRGAQERINAETQMLKERFSQRPQADPDEGAQQRALDDIRLGQDAAEGRAFLGSPALQETLAAARERIDQETRELQEHFGRVNNAAK